MRPRHSVLYDDTCALCRRQMRLLQRLDWGRALDPVPLSNPRAPLLAPGVPPPALQEALHCVAADGRIHRGAEAFRFLALRLPLLAPFGLVLWLPGALWLAGKVYGLVSRHRHRLSRLAGCDDPC